MAEPKVTGKTPHLRQAFAEFDELWALTVRINDDVALINRNNLNVGGDDDIGKQYHQQVDEGTSILTDLIDKIQLTMVQTSENGEALSSTLDRADDHTVQQINGI
jgi:hypothetical protein